MYVDALERGTRVGELQVQDVIGQGGFGIVYTAVHSFLGDVALKEFFPKSQASRSLSGQIVPSSPNKTDGFNLGVQRLIKEGKKLQQLQHPGVVPVFGVFESNGSAYLVMKRIAGSSLQGAIEKKDIVAAPALVDDFCRQMLAALDAVHKVGLVHRDVAPDNILVEPSPSGPRFVLIDFGGAKRVVSDATEDSSAALTKSGFSPPEQYASESSGGMKASPATDIYSFCATLYWLVTGKRPMDAPTRTAVDTITQLSSDPNLCRIYGKEWLAAVDKGMSLRPSSRFQDVASLRAALGRRSPPRRIGLWIFLGSIGFLLLLFALVVFIVVMGSFGQAGLGSTSSEDWRTDPVTADADRAAAAVDAAALATEAASDATDAAADAAAADMAAEAAAAPTEDAANAAANEAGAMTADAAADAADAAAEAAAAATEDAAINVEPAQTEQ